MGQAAATGGFYDALVDDDAQELYETAPCGYVSTDPSGMIVKANRTFLSWIGHDSDELCRRRKFQSLLSIGDRIFYETHFAPSLALHGSVREIALELVHASGEHVPVLLNAAVKVDADGKPMAIRIAVFDARQRRTYEQELVIARENAERSAAQAKALAETLQQTLLPPSLPSVDGLDIGGAFRPSGDGTVIGGDFYDVFEITGGDWGVSLGDVCGKGAAAAAVTALARYTVRAEAMRTSSAAQVLLGLHDALERSESETFLTGLYARVRIGDRVSITLSAGGHQLPLLVPDEGSIEEVGRAGALLGMLGPPRLHDTELRLAPGDALVLFTDGVTEARAGAEFFGQERLCSALEDLRGGSAQEMADGIAAAAIDFQHAITRDDIAIVVLKATPHP